MASQKSFHQAYLKALKATAKRTRSEGGGKRIPKAQRQSLKWEAATAAEDAELAERGSVVRDVTRNPNPYGYVVATDKFMSGWGKAKARSLYAIAVDSPEEADLVIENMGHRSEMKRVRFTGRLPRVSRGDHLNVTDKHHAPRFFKPPYEGGFATKD